jgi:hypothetical protein
MTNQAPNPNVPIGIWDLVLDWSLGFGHLRIADNRHIPHPLTTLMCIQLAAHSQRMTPHLVELSAN